jgi:hypothetical protein
MRDAVGAGLVPARIAFGNEANHFESFIIIELRSILSF